MRSVIGRCSRPRESLCHGCRAAALARRVPPLRHAFDRAADMRRNLSLARASEQPHEEEPHAAASGPTSIPDTGADISAGPGSQGIFSDVDPAAAHELELEELDAAQEQMLQWMALQPEEQEQDLDEMIDYGEFGDEEYEDLALLEEVEQAMEAAHVEIKLGDRVVGTVHDIDEDGAYVEIGQKYSGFVPLSECSFARLRTPLEALRVGMTREFVVAADVDDYDQIILSLAAQEASVYWHRLRQFQEESIVLHVRVVSANRGGLLVQYGPYEGFVPVSQFGPAIRPDTMETLVGSDIPATLLEVNENEERLVFSNKRVPLGLSGGSRALKSGDVCEGVVQSVRAFGAFLDLGEGVLGLLHVSQVSHERILNIAQVMQPGDRLKVMVLSTDAQRGRITLSTKKLEPTPGDMLRNPQRVYEQAEQMAADFRTRIEAMQAGALGLEGEARGQALGVEDFPM